MSNKLKFNQEINNPCLKEQKMSYECLDKNDYDHNKCAVFFENYKTCDKFWGDVKKSRRRQGIQPYLPVIEDRERVKEEFLKAHNTKS